MDDVVFTAVANSIIRYVDDKWGRAAGWLAAVMTMMIFVAGVVAAIWWLAP